MVNWIQMSTIKSQLRNLLVDTYVWNLRQSSRDKKELAAWLEFGKPVPPPAMVKRRVLAAYAAKFGTEILIETGTFMGDTICALKDRVKVIYSIELSADLMQKAKHRFRAYSNIHILRGDSGKILPKIMTDISQSCLFWLDGHYSGGFTAQAETDTSVLKELRTIFDHKVKDHVILIDDARLFDGTHDYPFISELRELFAKERPNYDFSVVNDVIRAHPHKNVGSEF
jgi:hypothetical protein